MPPIPYSCSACLAPIIAYKPQDDLCKNFVAKCRCTAVMLDLLTPMDNRGTARAFNVSRLEEVWGRFAGVLLDQERWVEPPKPCYRCNFEDLEANVAAFNAGKVHLPGAHTCGLDSRHQPAAS